MAYGKRYLISYEDKEIARLLELLPILYEKNVELICTVGGFDIETFVSGTVHDMYVLSRLNPTSWIAFSATEMYDLFKNPRNLEIYLENIKKERISAHYNELELIKEILFEIPLEELPLQINGKFPIFVKWRLEIGK